MRDAHPVVRKAEIQDREVARGDSLRIPGAFTRGLDPEEMPLLVVLIEGKEVVSQVVLLLLLRGLRIGSDEVDVLSVR